MFLIAIAWIYVVLMMAIAEATSPVGTVLGAFFTFVLYGVGPLALVLYLLNTPARRKARRLRESHEERRQDTEAGEPAGASAGDPDAGRHAAGAAVAPERKEP